MRVEDIMTRDAKTCNPETNLAAVAAIMWANDCGTVPVLSENRRVVGMITDRDICMAVATKGRLASDITTGEVINGDVHLCAPDNDIRNALDIMRKNKVRRLVVINGEGSFEGILSLNDIIIHSEEATDRKRVEVSNNDVMNALKAICEHRNEPLAAGQSQKTAIA